MCGIVGFISTKSDEQAAKRYFMKHALALDTLRGRDSTGTYTVTDKHKVKMRHSLKEGIDYVTTKSFNDTQFGVWCAVGHNRAATAGEVTRNNAHPFSFGDITMVHNGTLANDGSNFPSYDYKLPVDSMQICLALSKVEPEEADKVLSMIDGSFALVWFDKRDKTVNMARNNSRPLHFTYNTAKTHLWFMSDGSMLNTINRGFGHSQVGGNSIYSLKSMRHLKFKKGDLTPTSTTFKEYERPKANGRYLGSKDGGSLKTAAKKWQDNIRKHKAEIREEINGKKRRIPKPMISLVKQMFGLETDTFLEFVPDLKLLTSEKKYMMKGEVIIPEWGGCEWPAVIYNVPMAQAEAYKNTTWLVNPVGVTHSLDPEHYDTSMLCHLVHCKYDEWYADNEAARREEQESEDKDIDLLIPGPDGRMMKQSTVKRLQKQGCIQCGDPVEDHEMLECHLVNNGGDVMCDDCYRDIEKGVGPYGHQNLRNMMH